MKLPPFKLETYLSQWEFKAKYLFSCSDMETLSLKELLNLADPETLQLWEGLKLGYTEDQGLPLLRNEICKNYPGLSDSNILTFAGAEEGIFCLFHSLLDASDHVIVVTPCYQSLQTIPESIGSTVSKIPLEEKNRWRLDLTQVEKLIQKNTKLIIVNFPHNPTGVTLDLQTLEGLVEIARKHEIYLFSDEVYRLLELNPENRMPPVATIYEKGISLGVMSKAYGLPGLRIGWIATQSKDILHEAKLVKHYSSICNSGPSEILALIALRSSDFILKRNHNILSRNLSLLDAFISANEDILSWVRPTGGCVGFPRLNLSARIDAFASTLVNKHGVLIMPANVYDLSSNHFRIGFGRKNMPEALEIFATFAQDIHNGKIKVTL